MDGTLLISTGGGIAGALVGGLATAAVISGRAERDAVQGLLAQATRAITAVEIAFDSYGDERLSRRAQRVALAHVMLAVVAAKAESGRWLSSAAVALRDLRDWDLRQSERLASQYLPALSELSTAIVLLSMRSGPLSAACTKIRQDVVALSNDLKSSGARKTGADALAKDIAELSQTIDQYLKRRWWRPWSWSPASVQDGAISG